MPNVNNEEKSLFFMIKDSFTPRQSISPQVYAVLGAATFGLVLILWALLTYGGLVDSLFMPTPTAAANAAVKLFTELGYSEDILITIIRVMAGFVIAAVVAVPLGILIGTYTPVEALLEPIMSFIRYLPASAFIPLFILWIGVDEPEKIAVIITGSLPQLVLMVAVATRKVSGDLIEVAYTLGTSKSAVLWKVILPSSLPAILDAVRMVLGWAWTYVIVAELVGASSGIGYMIIQSQRMLSTANIFVGILSIGLIGLAFDYCFKILQRKLFPWS
ncbi:putative membrane protein [Propionispora sp. 2/2-37]|nr:putative membrane protein [Propionispora sp. 2/2-37]